MEEEHLEDVPFVEVEFDGSPEEFEIAVRLARGLEDRPIRPSINTLLDNPNNLCIKEFLDAIEAGDIEQAKMIHKKKEFDVSAVTGGAMDKFAIHFAAQNGNLECLKYLLENKAQVDVQERRRKTPLHLAVSGGHLEAVKLLIEAGAPLNVIDKFGRTPLMWAIAIGSEEILQELLKAGAIVSTQGQDKWHALHEACKTGSVNMAEALIKAGSSVNSPQEFSGCAPWSPLHIAVRQGNFDCVKLLLSHGAKVDSPNAGGHTPLHEAAYRGYDKIMFELLKRGANPNARSTQKRTPLHEACLQGKADAAALLLDACSWVNAKDLVYDTPLHLALRGNHPHDVAVELTSVLLQYGASPTMLGRDDEMPIEIARSSHQFTCVEILENSMASPRSLVILCKILIRRTLGCEVEFKAPLLPLPTNLKKYIMEMTSF